MRQGTERVLRNFSLHLPDINGEVHFAVSAVASPSNPQPQFRGELGVLRCMVDRSFVPLDGLRMLIPGQTFSTSIAIEFG
jgi:hypothetical protein